MKRKKLKESKTSAYFAQRSFGNARLSANLLTPEIIFSIATFMATQWGMERYKGFLISGSAVPTFATGFDWYSQRTVLRPGRLSSIIEVKLIQGEIFNSKEAEEDGFRLCKEWIDRRP